MLPHLEASSGNYLTIPDEVGPLEWESDLRLGQQMETTGWHMLMARLLDLLSQALSKPLLVVAFSLAFGTLVFHVVQKGIPQGISGSADPIGREADPWISVRVQPPETAPLQGLDGGASEPRSGPERAPARESEPVPEPVERPVAEPPVIPEAPAQPRPVETVAFFEPAATEESPRRDRPGRRERTASSRRRAPAPEVAIFEGAPRDSTPSRDRRSRAEFRTRRTPPPPPSVEVFETPQETSRPQAPKEELEERVIDPRGRVDFRGRARRTPRTRALPGVPFSSLESCGGERAAKEKVRNALGTRVMCELPGQGVFHFDGTRTLLISVEPVRGRQLGNYCQEIDLAYQCLLNRP